MSALHELQHVPTDAISAIRFSPSGSRFAVASWDRNVYVYARTPESTTPYTCEAKHSFPAPILDMCFGKNDEQLYIVGLDHAVRTLTTADDTRTILSAHTEPSNKTAYSSTQDLLLSTSWDNTFHVHDPTSTRYIRISLPAKPFALSLTDSLAVIAMSERKVSVYHLQALRTLLDQSGGTADNLDILTVEPWQQRESSLKFMTRAVACMPDGTGFATSSIEGRVGVEWFDPEAQKNMYAFKCHRQTQEVDGNEVDIVYPVNALAFHPGFGTFATGGGDGVVALWDAQTKRRVRQYPKLGASVAAMEFSLDGKFLVIGVSPGFEDGKEDEDIDQSLIKVVVRELGENEAKGKPVKEK